MKKYPIYLIIAVILGLFLVRFLSGPEDLWLCDKGTWIKHGNPSGPKPQTLCTATSTSFSFNKTGNLTQDTNTAWYLTYEEPGAPALRVKLLLTQECAMTNEVITCGVNSFRVGDRITAMGISENGNLENFILLPAND